MDFRQINKTTKNEFLAVAEDRNYRRNTNSGRDAAKARKVEVRRACRRSNKAVRNAEVRDAE